MRRYNMIWPLAIVAIMVSCHKLSVPATTEKPDPTDTTRGVPVGPDYMKNMLKYRPHDGSMWDNWYVIKNDEVHMFHLWGPLSNISYDYDVNLRGFGHAFTTDLLHWNEQPQVLSLVNAQTSYELDFHYSGCAYAWEGKYYMFYTMRRWNQQRIGVAMSNDLYSWERYSGNPVIEPDARWFIPISSQPEGWNGDDCRDMIVVRKSDGTGFYGYFVSSTTVLGYTSPTAAIGLAESSDLLNWKQKGIVYLPSGVSMPEMVDVFECNGRWYMTLTTAKNNGSLNVFSDPYVARATVYASSDTQEGPFVENVNDNVLLGGPILSGYSSRTVEFKGERRILYVDPDNGCGTICLPKTIGTTSEGYLRAYYASDLIPAIRIDKPTPTIYAQPNTSFAWPTHGGTWRVEGSRFICETDPNSWQPLLFNHHAQNMELFFNAHSSTCSSVGFVFSAHVASPTLNDIRHIIVADSERNMVYLSNGQWELICARAFNFGSSTEHTYRCILIGNTIEMYIDDILAFEASLNAPDAYIPGIFANDGKLEADEIEIYTLENTRS